MIDTPPFTGLTLKVSEFRHLLDKSEAHYRRALSERQADLADEDFAEVADEIGASVERIEVALDDIFLTRALYLFDARKNDVFVRIEDLLNLLMETDFQ